MTEYHSVEIERVRDVNAKLLLDEAAFRAAWHAFQNTPIDFCEDSDDEQCRAVGSGIKAYLASLVGVQCPEDAARAIHDAEWGSGAYDKLTSQSIERHKARIRADAVLALPHTGQPQEGWPAEYDRYIPDIVQNAMLTAWNEICSDTGHHPTDIERNFEGRKGHLGFSPAHWASLTGKFVAETLKRAAAPASPRAEGE